MSNAFDTIDTRDHAGGAARSAASRVFPMEGSLVVDVLDRPCAILADWSDLVSRVDRPTFYQGAHWCAAWMEACRAEGVREDVRIVTVRLHRRLVLVWPLVRVSVAGIGVLRAFGVPATQYADALAEPGPNGACALSLALKALRATPDVGAICLTGLRADARLASLPGIADGESDGDRWQVSNRRSAPIFRCRTPAGEGGPKRRSGRSLNALRRHMRGLEEHGVTAFEDVATRAVPALIDETLTLKAAWCAENGMVSAGYLHPANAEAARRLASMGRLRATRLTVGGETAATEIGIVDAGRYVSLMQAYDQRYAGHAPGRLLLQHTIETMPPDVAEFDFMPPSLPHKTEWTAHSVAVADYSLAFNRTGRLALAYLEQGRPKLVRVMRAMPLSLRRWLLRRY